MPDESGQLTGRQAAVLAALIEAPSVRAAAATCKVSERTIRRWLAEPAFLAAYRAARRQVVEEAVALIQRVAGAAVAALHKNLTCDRPAVEVAAAVAILDRAIKGIELADLAETVEELLRRDKERQEREKLQ
jgi:hypothetical protein